MKYTTLIALLALASTLNAAAPPKVTPPGQANKVAPIDAAPAVAQPDVVAEAPASPAPVVKFVDAPPSKKPSNIVRHITATPFVKRTNAAPAVVLDEKTGIAVRKSPAEQRRFDILTERAKKNPDQPIKFRDGAGNPVTIGAKSFQDFVTRQKSLDKPAQPARQAAPGKESKVNARPERKLKPGQKEIVIP